MAERYQGRVVRVSLAGSSRPERERTLGVLLEQTEGVKAYFVDSEENVLTAYLDDSHEDDSAIVRALVASGIFPIGSRDVGVIAKDGRNAC